MSKGKKFRFVVPGPPVGYISTTGRSKWTKEYRKYGDYAKMVRNCARAAGIPVPLRATKENQLIIKTISYFKNGVHCDPGNVQKGVADALFYDEEKAAMAKAARKAGVKPKKGRGTGKGDDKQTGGVFPPPLYDKENPRVIVIIKPHKRKKENK